MIGTQVDELEVRVYPEPADLIGAVPFLEAAWQGQLDGATLQLERSFMPTYGDTSPGTVILFAGRISDIDCTRTSVDIRCRSHLELLNIQMPRRLWQSSCTHLFGDAMCQFDRSSLQTTFSAGPGSTPVQIAASVDAEPRKSICARDHRRHQRRKCRFEPHSRKHWRRLGLCEARVSFAGRWPATSSKCSPGATARSRPAQTSSTTPFTLAAFPISRRRRPRYDPASRKCRRGRDLARAHRIITWAGSGAVAPIA